MIQEELPADVLLDQEVLAEAQLVELIEQKILNLDDITIRPVGTFLRGYQPDVLQAVKKLTRDGKQQWLVAISREGMYDTLPEALFHQTTAANPNPFKSKEDMQEGNRRRREEEQAARRFFLPLEREFYRLRLLLEIAEREMTPDTVETTSYWFDLFWDKTSCLSPRQKCLLFYLLPRTYQLAGKLDFLPVIYEKVMGHPISIKSKNGQALAVAEALVPTLGTARLGADTVCGVRINSEAPQLGLQIGPIPRSAVPDFLAGGRSLQAIQWLNRHFIPLEMEVRIEIFVEKAQDQFSIGPSMEEGRLSITTVL